MIRRLAEIIIGLFRPIARPIGELVHRCDRYMITNHPGLWAIRFHYVLVLSLSTLALAALAASLYPVELGHVPDTNYVFLVLVGSCVLVSTIWATVVVRDRRNWHYTRAFPDDFGIATQWICLLLINLLPFVVAGILEQRVSGLVSYDRFVDDWLLEDITNFVDSSDFNDDDENFTKAYERLISSIEHQYNYSVAYFIYDCSSVEVTNLHSYNRYASLVTKKLSDHIKRPLMLSEGLLTALKSFEVAEAQYLNSGAIAEKGAGLRSALGKYREPLTEIAKNHAKKFVSNYSNNNINITKREALMLFSTSNNNSYGNESRFAAFDKEIRESYEHYIKAHDIADE